MTRARSCGFEVDRGLWVTALAAAGYQVYAINPQSVCRYRDRHNLAGATMREAATSSSRERADAIERCDRVTPRRDESHRRP